jgi:photosystem II stability/assembly factor-like uncharacterized protein
MTSDLRRFLVVLAVIGVGGWATWLGAPPVTAAAASWVNITGNLAGMPSECGNLSFLSAMPSSSRVIASVAQKGLWANSSGNTWTQLGTGAGSDTITNRGSWIAYDPANANTFWEAGIYNGGGVYRTTNNGSTFTRLGTIFHNDYVSVDFSDPNRQTLLAGGHEQSQTVWKSTNGGQTWTNIGLNLPANTNFSSNPLILDSQTYVVNTAGWGTGTAGIYRTTNGGTSWQQVSAMGPGGAPVLAANGTIYWAFGGSLLKSTDRGVTWTQVGSGLSGVPPIEAVPGTLASLRGGTVAISTNGGTTWTSVGATLPYSPWGFTYSKTRKAFLIWKLDCGSVVQPDAVMSMDWDLGGGSGPTPPAPPTGLRIIVGH